MQTSGGEYDLTSTAQIVSGQYVFNVDVTPGTATPFYEDAGAAIRTNMSSAIYDQPSAGHDDGSATSQLCHNPAGTTRTQIAHFDSFLTRDEKTLFRYCLTVTDRWRLGAAYRPSAIRELDKAQTVVLQQVTNRIPPEFHGALRSRYPQFDYLII